MAAKYNELQFMSVKPFNLSQKTRDASNRQFIRHPGEDMEDVPRRDKPLRGYMQMQDYEMLEETK